MGTPGSVGIWNAEALGTKLSWAIFPPLNSQPLSALSGAAFSECTNRVLAATNLKAGGIQQPRPLAETTPLCNNLPPDVSTRGFEKSFDL